MGTSSSSEGAVTFLAASHLTGIRKVLPTARCPSNGCAAEELGRRSSKPQKTQSLCSVSSSRSLVAPTAASAPMLSVRLSSPQAHIETAIDDARDGAKRDTHRYGHLGWQQEEDAVDARAANAADRNLDRILGAARGLLVGVEGGRNARQLAPDLRGAGQADGQGAGRGGVRLPT